MEAVLKNGIKILNVTSDGLPANQTMCERLGASMDHHSIAFKPYMRFSNDKIYIIKDAPHMLKLVRNTYGSKQIIFDRDGGEIKWSYIEKLVEYGKTREFRLIHKLNQKHLQWKRCIMKVDIADQTLSASTAGSLKFLIEQGENDFRDAGPTIRFITIFDKLFDVFNTKYNDKNEPNVFKRALSPNNRVAVFALFEEAIEYIENLQIIDQEEINEKIPIIDSRSFTGFRGFINNMHVLRLIYQEYIENNQLLDFIPTYRLCQDPLEMYFGKNRACNGHNDSPTPQQFEGANRKLQVFDNLLCSKYSNCNEIDIPNQPIGNILYVSSRSSSISSTLSEDNSNVTSAELETMMQKLSEIEAMEENCLLDSLKDYTIAYISGQIENRIGKNDRIHCSYCEKIFKENAKIQNVHIGFILLASPCKSTFDICKATDRLLKLSQFSEQVSCSRMHAGVLSCLEMNTLFEKTDFSHDFEHKLFFVKAIVDIYVQIKNTSIARSINLNSKKDFLRTKLKKIIHFSGQ